MDLTTFPAFKRVAHIEHVFGVSLSVGKSLLGEFSNSTWLSGLQHPKFYTFWRHVEPITNLEGYLCRTSERVGIRCNANEGCSKPRCQARSSPGPALTIHPKTRLGCHNEFHNWLCYDGRVACLTGVPIRHHSFLVLLLLRDPFPSESSRYRWVSRDIHFQLVRTYPYLLVSFFI